MWYEDQVASSHSEKHVLSQGIYVVRDGCTCTTVTVYEFISVVEHFNKTMSLQWLNIQWPMFSEQHKYAVLSLLVHPAEYSTGPQMPLLLMRFYISVPRLAQLRCFVCLSNPSRPQSPKFCLTWGAGHCKTFTPTHSFYLTHKDQIVRLQSVLDEQLEVDRVNPGCFGTPLENHACYEIIFFPAWWKKSWSGAWILYIGVI